jgi:hypothetical protein
MTAASQRPQKTSMEGSRANRYCMPHSEPRWKRDSLEHEVRAGMREGRFAGRYSD